MLIQPTYDLSSLPTSSTTIDLKWMFDTFLCAFSSFKCITQNTEEITFPCHQILSLSFSKFFSF